MVSDCGPECKGSVMKYFLEVETKRDRVRSLMRMQREQDSIPSGMMVSDYGCECNGSRTTYSLEMDRKQDRLGSDYRC
jgi:hypothetical protein